MAALVDSIPDTVLSAAFVDSILDTDFVDEHQRGLGNVVYESKLGDIHRGGGRPMLDTVTFDLNSKSRISEGLPRTEASVPPSAVIGLFGNVRHGSEG
jgi:hypothetical protein